MVHELLHIHRYWVETIPQLVPWPGDAMAQDTWHMTSAIENDIDTL